jgi:acyl-CoA synthetase (AMP-forming)/AMP-acid ligase II
MTSGTTAAPKSAVLRHQHLTSYIVGSVEFAGAAPDSAALVSVPPYHIAAVANLLSNIYAGRRIVYLDRFTPDEWLEIVEQEHITNAMLVPTMLARIVYDLQDRRATGPECLQSLSYGGSKVAPSVIAAALRAFPNTGFVNGYGLTETSSTIALLGPDDHREALASDDPAVNARLGLVGRALPEVTIEIHDLAGKPVPAGELGDIVVRGPQVAGEYLEGGSRLDPEGWFLTRDIGYMDEGGFIFIQGRADDTIIRGGENIAPAEIEMVIDALPEVRECAVAGLPDEEWGQRIAAFVVLAPGASMDEDTLRTHVRAHLRGFKTPHTVVFMDDLPHTATGKLLRRRLIADYQEADATS